MTDEHDKNERRTDSEFTKASDLPYSGGSMACLMGHLGCSGPAGELGSCLDCRRYAEVTAE